MAPARGITLRGLGRGRDVAREYGAEVVAQVVDDRMSQLMAFLGGFNRELFAGQILIHERCGVVLIDQMPLALK